MAIGIFLWSLFGLISSYVTSFGPFIAMRALVGIGEASYYILAPAMISDLYVGNKRSNYLALFLFTIPFGRYLFKYNHQIPFGILKCTYIKKWSWICCRIYNVTCNRHMALGDSACSHNWILFRFSYFTPRSRSPSWFIRGSNQPVRPHLVV